MGDGFVPDTPHSFLLNSDHNHCEVGLVIIVDFIFTSAQQVRKHSLSEVK